jgi:hypothetical protein
VSSHTDVRLTGATEGKTPCLAAVRRLYRSLKLLSSSKWRAANRALRAEMGVFVLAVDAKDEPAAALFPHFGFVAFASKLLQLFLPLATIART